MFAYLMPFLFLFVQDQQDSHTNLKKGVAVSGYDVVSYFKQGPKEGSSKIKTTYKGVTYKFSSEGNKSEFLNSPEKYIPAYGGWCAYAMGVDGSKVKVDPDTYKIVDDKLYLFYNFWGNNTLVSWNTNENQLKSAADKYWKQIVASE